MEEDEIGNFFRSATKTFWRRTMAQALSQVNAYTYKMTAISMIKLLSYCTDCGDQLKGIEHSYPEL